jgi:mannose-1-phosphate guanylyltransferase
MKLIPVIISGGVGSRLWPVSRAAHPKPFIKLPDGESLISKTFRRACALENVVEVLTVTNQELYFKTQDEYHKAQKNTCPLSYILEPFGRNTAAAIAAAALQIQQTHGDDAIMLVLATDHLIEDDIAFSAAVKSAQNLAEQGWHVTFGIEPEYLETGFGYIEADKKNDLSAGFKIKRFVEKPDLKKAEEYIKDGNYYWNSGMFCFKAAALLADLKTHAPEVLENTKHALESARKQDIDNGLVVRMSPDYFANVPDISIDYALLEKSESIAMVPCNIGWSDIGTWHAMGNLVAPDENQNRFDGEVIAHNSSCNYVHSPKRLTALVGVEDLVIVDTDDALLIAHKDHTQDVKHIVAQLKSNEHKAHLLHQTVHRPWGTYTLLEEGKRFKIKRIEVKPGASLSLQMHHHRSEHWVVVSGMAKVVNDVNEFYLNTNESTYIPAGHKHRLENPGLLELVMIEVQSGGYLGEDDIVRFEDNYGRV